MLRLSVSDVSADWKGQFDCIQAFRTVLSLDLASVDVWRATAQFLGSAALSAHRGDERGRFAISRWAMGFVEWWLLSLQIRSTFIRHIRLFAFGLVLAAG